MKLYSDILWRNYLWHRYNNGNTNAWYVKAMADLHTAWYVKRYLEETHNA